MKIVASRPMATTPTMPLQLQEQYIPKKYNVKSKVYVEITDQMQDLPDFDLKSDGSKQAGAPTPARTK